LGGCGIISPVMFAQKLVRAGVRRLRAYEPHPEDARVRLDANESPYALRLPGEVLRGLRSNRYPDPRALGLRGLYARCMGLQGPEWVLHGNGSDELIYYIIVALGGPVLYPTPTFSMYGLIARALGQRVLEVPLKSDFSLPGSFFQAARRAKVVFLSSPNNPTGNAFSRRDILRLLALGNSLVVVDEAYQPFSARASLAALLGRHENLAVLRSLSKVGLAALRVGFLLAQPWLLRELNKVRLPYNLNALSQALACHFLSRPQVLERRGRDIVKERRRLYQALRRLPALRVYPSEANFLLFRVRDAEGVHQGLLRRGVLVRELGPQVPGCLRVTVGTRAQNDAFLRALKEVLS